MLDTSLKPEADKLNAIAEKMVSDLTQKCQQLAAELDAANENVRKQEKTDARENADLQIAREQQAMANHAHITTQRQLAAIKSCIEGYEPKGVITLGTTVELKMLYVDNKAPDLPKTKFIVKMVEHDAGDAATGFISTDCAVGSAIIGRIAGDIISVQVPQGTIQYKIERIY